MYTVAVVHTQGVRGDAKKTLITRLLSTIIILVSSANPTVDCTLFSTHRNIYLLHLRRPGPSTMPRFPASRAVACRWNALRVTVTRFKHGQAALPSLPRYYVY